MFVISVVPNANELAASFRCSLDALPSLYLGLPLRTKAKASVSWEPVISCIQKRLASWKARFLSFGARLVLIKSVLKNLPIYYMSVLKAPASVITRIERLRNNFLWEGTEERKRMHMVNWDLVKTPMRRGGLGILDLRYMNRALLAKWTWNFSIDKETWWRSLMVEKCGIGRSEWQPRWNLAWSVVRC
ncbi:Putative ribonuclease H protein At1g65750 [Linum perenne]